MQRKIARVKRSSAKNSARRARRIAQRATRRAVKRAVRKRRAKGRVKAKVGTAHGIARTIISLWDTHCLKWKPRILRQRPSGMGNDLAAEVRKRGREEVKRRLNKTIWYQRCDYLTKTTQILAGVCGLGNESAVSNSPSRGGS
jgi:hypothetical protein